MKKKPTIPDLTNLFIMALKEAVIIGFKIFVVSYIAILIMQNVKF